MAMAAFCTSSTTAGVCGLFGFARKAMTLACGASSKSNSSRLAVRLAVRKLTPVRFPPGWERLAIRPSTMGSPPMTATIGIFEVACFAAIAEGSPPPAVMMSTFRPTRSEAKTGNRSSSLSAQRYSIARFRPSEKPLSFSPVWNAATRSATCHEAALWRKPITGIAFCLRADERRPCG
jgi:hypothetical protein